MPTQMASDGGLNDVVNLLNLVKDQKTTQSTSTNISQAGVTQQINDILQGNSGLAAVAGAQKSAGLYNSSTNSQLTNDLLARASAQVAAKNATTSTTTSKKASLTKGNIESLLASSALKKALGGKGPIQNAKDAYNSIADELGFGAKPAGIGDPISSSIGSEPAATGSLADGYTSSAVADTIPNAINSSGVVDSIVGSGASDAAGEIGAATFADGSDAGIGALTSAELTDGAGSGLAAAGGDVAGLEAADSAAAAGEGASAGSGALAATGWAALAIATAADAKSTLNGDDSNASDFLKYTGDLGTSDVIRGIDSGNIADSVNPLGRGLLEDVGLPSHGGWIVCTELLRQGKFNRKHYVAGLKVFESYPRHLLCGYYVWATPLVSYIRRNPSSWVTGVCRHVFAKRAEYLAARAGVSGARDTVYGQSISALMFSLCFVLGHVLNWLSLKEVQYGRN